MEEKKSNLNPTELCTNAIWKEARKLFKGEKEESKNYITVHGLRNQDYIVWKSNHLQPNFLCRCIVEFQGQNVRG